MRVRRSLIRREVTRLLTSQGITKPPVPVERIARALDIEVCRTPAGANLSGFLAHGDGVRPVIGVNQTEAPNRQRFTIAHELGHFVLHASEPIHVDERASVRVSRRSPLSSTGEDIQEVEANTFAAELLMPKVFLEEDLANGPPVDLADDRRLKVLARRYEVSAAAMTYRLTNLQLI
jgi:Zn-dependent peptidase ImmA (M78 family)